MNSPVKQSPFSHHESRSLDTILQFLHHIWLPRAMQRNSVPAQRLAIIQDERNHLKTGFFSYYFDFQSDQFYCTDVVAAPVQIAGIAGLLYLQFAAWSHSNVTNAG